MEDKVIIVTEEQLKKLFGSSNINAIRCDDKEVNNEGKKYVYGIRGIRELFNVSHVTACKYKRSFLKPAISQRGRKIVVDVQKAMELFNDRSLTV